MPIRLIDTNIWSEDWYLSLNGEEQYFLRYIFDNCNHAGIFKPNTIKYIKLTSLKIDQQGFLNKINEDKERIYVLKNGRWFLRDFIKFQCFNKQKEFKLNLKVVMYRSIYELIKLENIPLEKINGFVGLDNEGVTQGVGKGVTQPTKDKDKDKDKEKVKDVKIHIRNKERFEKIWERYPRREGRKEAERHFIATVKTDQDWESIKWALENYKEYLKKEKIEKRFIKMGSTWFNNWQDWKEQPGGENQYNKGIGEVRF